MKHLFTLYLCLASVITMNAQSVSLFDIDASGFPTVQAKFFAFDAAGKQQRPNVSELTLTESGLPRQITNVSCPTVPQKSLSVCIMVDTYGYGLINLAQAGTQRLINFLNPPKDEIAITIMSNGVQIHQDFTSDMTKATASVVSIPGASGVDIQSMFYFPIAGGIPFISGRSAEKKVLILISDLHCPTLNIDEAKLYQDAVQQNIAVYTVLLGTTDYSGLFKRVATKTGGKVFENVRTETQITNIFQEIERFEHTIPCEISWSSITSCPTGERKVELMWNTITAQSSYSAPTSANVVLQVTPPFIAFGGKRPQTITDTQVTLTAQNADFIITRIDRMFGSADFTIVNTPFPFIIPQNSFKTITLRFVPSDSSKKFISFEISTNQCQAYMSASGGFIGKKLATPTLKLTKPNGGEVYVAGSDTLITWDGIVNSDTVELEYSIDNGTTWKSITTTANNLQYVWRNIPKPASNQCKIRVKQYSFGISSVNISKSLLDLRGHSREVYAIHWSPDGTKIATASWDGLAIIWSATNGSKLFTLRGHANSINAIQWSSDGSKVATASGDNTAIIWSATSGTKLFTLIDHIDNVFDIQWSPDGSKVATASYDNTAIIWSATNGTKLITLKMHTNSVRAIKWSPDASKVATASDDNTAIFWSATSGTNLFTLSGHTNYINTIQWSPDGTKVATASWDGTAIIWSATTGTKLLTLNGHTNIIWDIQWSPDGSKVATASGDNTAIIWSSTSGANLYTLRGHTQSVNAIQWSPDGTKISTASGDNTAIIWSATTGTKLFTLSGHNERLTTVQWNPDGMKVSTASWDNTTKIWNVDVVNDVLQEDESDAVFSIIAPEPTLQNLSIDMGKVLVGQSKDSTVIGIVCNKGSAPLHVLGIDITSGDSTDFSIPRGAGDFFLDSNKRCQDVMFGFAPTKVGIWTAKATIRTTVGDFIDTITITGEGIAPALAIVNPFIDFGQTLVGKPKDSNKVVTIKNVGTSDLTITQTDYNTINTTNFSTIAGGNPFILKSDSAAIMDLRFLPNDVGRRSGILQFHYNGVGSPATVQLFGEGIINIPDTARTTVIAQDITAQAGEKVNLSLKLFKPSGMQAIGAPTDWYARIHYNKSILFNGQSNNVCPGTTGSCVLELTGVYNPKSDELISIPCITTLGNTDHSTIVIDTFYWKNSVIATEVATQNGTITINGTCEDGGVRLFIPANSSTSLSTRPNPAQDNLQIQYGLREPLTVTLELLNMTGQVVQTIITNQSQAAGQYTLTSDLSVLSNGVYLLRLKTNKEMLTTRVDVVK